MARMIILYPYIKAVVTYNYDNFLKEAISILLESREEYFTLDELERIGKRNLVIQDVSGFVYAQEMTDDILSIYHVHGYIQPPSESFIADNNQIVLSLDEYHENEKNIYSWPTATQLHFLSHYTCILAGMSLTANGNPNIKNEQYLKAYSSIREVKNVYHAKCGLNVIYNREGYFQLYKELNTIVDNLNI